jgi:hypothetical protein
MTRRPARGQCKVPPELLFDGGMALDFREPPADLDARTQCVVCADRPRRRILTFFDLPLNP